MRDGLRKRLREATEAVHSSAEQQVDLRASIETPDGYCRFLSVMHTALSSFAEPLDHSSLLSGLAPRSATLVDALETDLAELAGERPAPRPHRPPSASSDLYSIGVGYTLEGSSVGAGVLRRRVTDDAPTHYLDALLGERRDRWTHYSRWLDDQATAVPTGIDPAIDGASDVFRCVIDAITAPPYEIVGTTS